MTERDVAALLGVFLVHVVVVVSPGPNFLLVAHTAVAHSRPAAVWSALGVACGAFLWASAALVGVAAFVAAFPAVYAVVKVVGAAYLLWMAIGLWRRPGRAAVEPSTVETSARHAFVRGVITNLSNPKSMIFFGSIFAASLPADAPAQTRALAVSIIVADAAVWYSAVAFLMSSRALRNAYSGLQRKLDRAAAVVLAGFSARIALTPD